ncbi:MAG TPA: serine/threonine protein phosphatase [Cyanothece sp. UBA12306]|nr:serine/threonine protein phosphatase [Cyanothece sp. UBA12306]
MSKSLNKWFKRFVTRFKSPLSKKIVFWVFIGVITIEVIILVPSVQRREKELLNQIKTSSNQIISWILLTYPEASTEEIIDHLKTLKKARSVVKGGAVYQTSGQLIGTFGNPPQLSISQLNNYSPRRNGSVYDDQVWSDFHGTTHYTIILRHDASDINSELINYIGRIVGLIIIISLFLTITVWLALEPILITPIFRLRSDLLRAGKAIYHDQDPPQFNSFNLQRKDELGDVILAFKQMFSQITEAIYARKQVEIALKNSLKREEDYSQALNEELEEGRLMQADFLPHQLLNKPGWQISAFMSPASQVAGDFYDVFELPNNNIGLVVADVCGKGVGAALFMGLFRSLIRIFSGQFSVETIQVLNNNYYCYIDMSFLAAVKLTNDYICANHDNTGIFCTIFFGILDSKSGQMSYINAGHDSLVIINSKGEIKETLEATGTPVGMLTDIEFEIKQTSLDSGDILLGYTDGVTEARSKNKEFFTEKRLLEIIQKPFTSAQEILETVKSEVLTYIGDGELSDDITILAIRRK